MVLRCLDDCTYKVSYLLPGALMYEKILCDLWEGWLCTPFRVPQKPPSTHLKYETPEIILIALAKNLFGILKNEVRNQKVHKVGVYPTLLDPCPINVSPNYSIL